MMRERPAEAVRVQSLFRDVNDRIAEIRSLELEVICECADSTCFETIALTADEYETARSRPHWFITKPGHEVPDLEHEIRRGETFLIVKKTGAGIRPAQRLDPHLRRPRAPSSGRVRSHKATESSSALLGTS